MLKWIYTLAAAAGAALLCLLTGAFENWHWLWLLPAGFAGCYLVLVAGLFLLIVGMAACVDMEKKQESDNPFYRAVTHGAIAVGAPLMRIRIHYQGLDIPLPQGRCMVVSNHLHELDPVFLLPVFKKQRLAFISKREVDDMFLVGPFLHKMLGQPINRENDREALKTILGCIKLLKEDKASIGVFPEGYCSKDRMLHPFRSGVFKIAQKAGVPIVVCTLGNTYQILPNFKKYRPTDVHMHIVGVIPAEELQGITTVEIGHRVHAMMAQDLGPDRVLQEIPQTS